MTVDQCPSVKICQLEGAIRCELGAGHPGTHSFESLESQVGIEHTGLATGQAPHPLGAPREGGWIAGPTSTPGSGPFALN